MFELTVPVPVPIDVRAADKLKNKEIEDELQFMGVICIKDVFQANSGKDGNTITMVRSNNCQNLYYIVF